MVLTTCVKRIWLISIGKVLQPSLPFASLLIHAYLTSSKMNNLTKLSIIKIIAQTRQSITQTIKLEFLEAKREKPDLLSSDLRERPPIVPSLYTRRINSLKTWTKPTLMTLRKKDQVYSNNLQQTSSRERARPLRRLLKTPPRLLVRRLGLAPSLLVREWKKSEDTFKRREWNPKWKNSAINVVNKLLKSA